MPAPLLQTRRLLLRRWRDADRIPFAQLNDDTVVMAHFPKRLTRAESDAAADSIQAGLEARDFGFWAVEIPGQCEFIGFVGLSRPSFTAPFTPCVEVGWRLARAHWGHGYATEAAEGALDHGFGTLHLPEIVAFTVPGNVRSRAVMERLGMRCSPADDFDHPRLSEGHPLRPHVLYRLSALDWAARHAGPAA